MRIVVFMLALASLSILTEGGETPRVLPFQARLVDASGKSLPDATATVQFQLFDKPTGGLKVWSGELHRVTVNGGLANLVLGTRNPFPLSRTNDAGAVLSFFDATLYLEVTVDSAGLPGGGSDGAITEADSPLGPRQILLPTVFAQESANSRLLAGHDWSALFGTNDPTVGKLSGLRIQSGSLTGNQLATNTITAIHLVDSSVRSNHLSDASITSRHLADESISIQKQAARVVGGLVPAGGIAQSPIVSAYLHSPISELAAIQGLEVTLPSTGRPTWICLIPDASTDLRSEPQLILRGNVSGDVGVHVFLYRNGQAINRLKLFYNFGDAYPFSANVSASSVQFLDTAAQRGTNAYSLRFSGVDSGDGLELVNLRLIAYEF